MSDLISRQAAIDALRNYLVGKNVPCDGTLTCRLIENEVINKLLSAQTEIIQCKDCKHFVRDDIEEYAPYGFYNTYFHAFCDKHWDKAQGEYIDVNLDDYCSFAERREVTT